MEKISAIIVDDEPQAREGVALLAQADPDIAVQAVCSNGVEALDAILEQRPQLLFLDIQMPQINGFELLNSIDTAIRPEVIFITAYDEYTLKAFEVHAVDYLLKPFTDERFYKALSFAKARIRQQELLQKKHQLEKLLQAQRQEVSQQREASVLSAGKPSGRLAVKVEGRVHLLPYRQIIWVEAYDYYVKIHVKERFYLVRDSMKNMERNLPADQFVRIHKSSIVNLAQIAPIENKNADEVQLISGEQLKVSRNYRENFKEKLAGH
jgi:two-component system LytT family response regulator